MGKAGPAPRGGRTSCLPRFASCRRVLLLEKRPCCFVGIPRGTRFIFSRGAKKFGPFRGVFRRKQRPKSGMPSVRVVRSAWFQARRDGRLRIPSKNTPDDVKRETIVHRTRRADQTIGAPGTADRLIGAWCTESKMRTNYRGGQPVLVIGRWMSY